MNTKRGLLLLALPAGAILALLGAAILVRSGPAADVPRLHGKPLARELPRSPETRPPARVAPVQASPPELVRAADEARIRGTFQNFRTAVATNNQAAQESLEKILRHDQAIVLKIAQEEAAKARTDRDREIASRTMEALRRQP